MNAPKIYANPVCKGSWFLGTNCGTCERCIDTKADWISVGSPRVNIGQEQSPPPPEKPNYERLIAACADIIRNMLSASQGDFASLISLCEMVVGGVVFTSVRPGMEKTVIDILAANVQTRVSEAREAQIAMLTGNTEGQSGQQSH